MIKIGITGGIGSGKSIVASLFALYGIPVYIADTESKILTNTSETIRQKLTALFDDSLYTETGLDKKKLASYIFNDPKLLETVNRIIHPEVAQHFQNWVAQQTGNLCIIESAILFESGFNSLVDKTITVFAPEEIRIKRSMQRDNVSEETIRQRMKNQMAEEVKINRSDFIINNDDSKALIPQVYAILTTLNP